MVKVLLALGKSKVHRYRRCLLKVEWLELLCLDQMQGLHRWLDGMGVESRYCGFWLTVRSKHITETVEKTVEGGTSRWVQTPALTSCPFPPSFSCACRRRKSNRKCLFLRPSLNSYLATQSKHAAGRWVRVCNLLNGNSLFWKPASVPSLRQVLLKSPLDGGLALSPLLQGELYS